MPKWSYVVISIVVIIISIYLIGFFVSIIFKNIFKFKLIKRSKSINFLINQNHSLLIDLKNEVIKKKIKIKESNLTFINNIDRNVDVLSPKFDYKKMVNDYSENYNYLLNLLKNDSKNKVTLIKDAINNNNDNLRKNIAIYNSNVIGYTYWINVKWYKWILKLFKFRKFERIN